MVNKLSRHGIVKGAFFLLPFIDRALEHAFGELTSSDVIDLAVQDKMQVWIVGKGEMKAVCITEVVEYPGLKAVRIVTLSGTDFLSWGEALYETLERFARKQGCTRLEAYGRPGLTRLLQKLDFRQIYIGVARDILG